MDAVLITWRWQNILSIAVMVVGICLLVTIGSQAVRKITGASDA